MRIHKGYILICLSLWIHFDDVLLTSFPVLQHVPLAAEDDQYLSIQRGPGLKLASVREKFRLIGLKPNSSEFFFFTTIGWSPESYLAREVDPSILYVLMSLQL